jgi:hypothetical protein
MKMNQGLRQMSALCLRREEGHQLVGFGSCLAMPSLAHDPDPDFSKA